MTTLPSTVTVFMAAYNAAPYIAEAIQSILDQSFQDLELLIVNDGSTDNTVEIIRSFDDPRIRLIDNKENKGLGFTRNVALKEAKGEFLAILDADDIAFPKRLEKQLSCFHSNPRLTILGGSAYIINKHGKRTGESIIPPTGSDRMRAILFFTNTFVHSSVMMRTSAFREVGGYPNHPVAQDYALFSRIALKHEVENIPEYLVEYRIHDSNISLRKQNFIKQELRDILSYQLQHLSVDTRCFPIDILLDTIAGSPYNVHEYYIAYSKIILCNREKKLYPVAELERILFENWYHIVMEKGGAKTLSLFLKKPVFNKKYATAKQFRRTFKKSLKYLLGVTKLIEDH